MVGGNFNFFCKVKNIINEIFETSEGRETALDMLRGYDEKTVFRALEQVTLVSSSEIETAKNDWVRKGQDISRNINMFNNLNSNLGKEGYLKNLNTR